MEQGASLDAFEEKYHVQVEGNPTETIVTGDEQSHLSLATRRFKLALHGVWGTWLVRPRQPPKWVGQDGHLVFEICETCE